MLLHTALSDRRRALRALTAAPLGLMLASCASDPTLAQPPTIVPVAAWGGQPVPWPAQPQRITHLTVHHQGELFASNTDVPAYLRKLQTWSRNTRKWQDIPYHYVVAPDGQVYAARPPELAGETNTEYNPTGHLLVMLLGNFEVQQPTRAQWDGTVRLLVHLLRTHGMTPRELGVHLDYSTQTVCPGENLMKRWGEMRRQIAQVGGWAA